MSEVRTRFAPSPTGFMHVGNLRTALYAWLLARSEGGKFILRIEDTDQARYVENAVDVIYATLKSAGLEHDEGPDKDGGYGPYIQSERKGLYREYAEKLVKNGHAYYCFCEKCDDESDTGEIHEASALCPCAAMDAAEAAAKVASGVPHVIRQRIDRSKISTFTDAVFGEIQIENKVLDDQILLKQDNMPTYNFANVVDDHLMNITHVVRGSEYLSSTPKYNLLYEAFGWEIPTYVHLPLIMGRDAEGNVSKLSKRHGSVSFENLVAEGYLPEAIVNYIALLGWSPKSDREIFTLAELGEVFKISGLNKSPAVFDYDKLRWMNSEYIKVLAPEKFAEIAKPFAKITGTALESKWEMIAALLHGRTEILTEIPEKIAFLIEQPEYDVELFNHKKSKSDPENTGTDLPQLRDKLAALEVWNAENISGVLSGFAAEKEIKAGRPMWQVRIAVSGCAVTPGGPGEIMEILGKEESLARIDKALKKLQA
ncbi:MAG: glutamate--tRNA ligase [Lentisphaerae bacterium]|nr:glutamate--tRNA ligase [Lentisphaerota bacterium]